jgi:hypothetical protein
VAWAIALRCAERNGVLLGGMLGHDC